MQLVNCRRVHAFWKGILVSVSSRTIQLSISHLAKDWLQHYPQFQFLISDPGGCFVSNEPREWAGIRGVGLLTAPGEFHGFTADLENLIRVIKRLARKLAVDHPGLTLASCVSLACFSHNNGFKTGGYSPVQWAFGADSEEHMRQQRHFSITVDLEDYTNKFITEAPITRERSRQRQESFTAQELSMLRGVLGTASWSAQQMSPQFAADVSLLLRCMIFWTPTSWSETCVAVLHSLFNFTHSMRPRGSS